MRLCEVVGCEEEGKRRGLCVSHAFTWLVSSESHSGPGYGERRRAFIARASLWMQAQKGALPEGTS